jgi:hypothetical protein
MGKIVDGEIGGLAAFLIRDDARSRLIKAKPRIPLPAPRGLSKGALLPGALEMRL